MVFMFMYSVSWDFSFGNGKDLPRAIVRFAGWALFVLNDSTSVLAVPRASASVRGDRLYAA